MGSVYRVEQRPVCRGCGRAEPMGPDGNGHGPYGQPVHYSDCTVLHDGALVVDRDKDDGTESHFREPTDAELEAAWLRN